MKARSFALPLFLAALLALGATAPLSAADTLASASVRLSAPDQPAVLHIDLPGSALHITGTEGDTITVESSLKQRTMITSEPSGDTKQTVPGFTLTEHANSISLALADDAPGTPGQYQISVPRHLALEIRNKELGGDLLVQEVAGDLEINVVNSAVRLEGVSGSAVINTVNGQVYVRYNQAPQRIISITSMNGETELQLPADTKASVQLRTHHGIVATDFKAAKLKTKKVSTKNPRSVITIQQDGSYTLGADPTPLSLEDLTIALNKSAARDKEAPVILRTSDNTAQQNVISVLNAITRAGFSKVRVQSGVSDDTPAISSPDSPNLQPGGKVVSGPLNGGGVDISISSMNGSISLRQDPPASSPADGTKDNVTVRFQDPDNFTDVREESSSFTSEYYLEELRDHVQRLAAPRLPAGASLTVTFLDLDLAGDIRPDRRNIRILTGVTLPRAHLQFQLRDANGQVLQAGERQLTNVDYQNSLALLSRNDPLYYDKQLLTDWITREFKKTP